MKHNPSHHNDSTRASTHDSHPEIETIPVLTDILAAAPTKRLNAPGLEALLGKTFPILDHGFIRVVDYMGDDRSIVQAARVSYGSGTKRVSRDKGLIAYLLRHQHTTPFEMCELKIHVKLPIFVARQWIRHRTASVNEYSARYSILDREFYLPNLDCIQPQSDTNKQGRNDTATLSESSARVVRAILQRDADECYRHYDELLHEHGVARELARVNLTLGHYTQWYWKTNLHNLLHFIRLRVDSHAQHEIRVYADCLQRIVKAWVPYTHAAAEEHLFGSYTFSKTALETLRKRVRGEEVDRKSSGLSAREWRELTEVLDNERP